MTPNVTAMMLQFTMEKHLAALSPDDKFEVLAYLADWCDEQLNSLELTFPDPETKSTETTE